MLSCTGRHTTGRSSAGRSTSSRRLPAGALVAGGQAMPLSPSPLLALVATALLGSTTLLLACGGKITSTDSSTRSAQASSEGEQDSSQRAAGGQSPGADRDCRYVSGGGSGGVADGVASCLVSSTFACSAGDARERSIACECSTKVGSNGVWGGGSCTCGDLTFAFDCDNACRIGAAEYQKCGLPTPPPDPGGHEGGSTSSTSGWAPGSSTSSSGGSSGSSSGGSSSGGSSGSSSSSSG